jgi:hypothetical protein
MTGFQAPCQLSMLCTKGQECGSAQAGMGTVFG